MSTHSLPNKALPTHRELTISFLLPLASINEYVGVTRLLKKASVLKGEKPKQILGEK